MLIMRVCIGSLEGLIKYLCGDGFGMEVRVVG